MIKDDANCTGTSCYRGYCVDLVARLSRDLHFTYELMESDDGKWGGYYNTTDSWDGLVKMLIDKVKGSLCQSEVIELSKDKLSPNDISKFIVSGPRSVIMQIELSDANVSNKIFLTIFLLFLRK